MHTEQERNRQINFFVMRYMWQKKKGRAKKSKAERKGNISIYDALRINRERYTRAIDHGSIRYKGEVIDNSNPQKPTPIPELDYLIKLTGLREEIFTGAVRFECAPDPITDKEWDELFTCRSLREEASTKKPIEPQKGDQTEREYHYPGDGRRTPEQQRQDNAEYQEALKRHEKRKAHYEKACDNYKTVEKIVTDKLEKSGDAEPSGTDFGRLCYFLENNTPAPNQFANSVVAGAIKVLSSITFNTLDVCGDKQLKGFCDQLKKSLKLANAISDYRGASGVKK